MIKRALFLTFATLIPLDMVEAQHPFILQKLTEWNGAASEPGRETLAAEVLKAAKNIYGPGNACSTSEMLIERVNPATAERFVFSSIIAKKLRNAWTVTARLPGCDEVPVRYMVMQNVDGGLTTIRVNRGVSHAWDSLIGDTLPFAHLAALAALKRQDIECATDAAFRLGPTRIASEDENLGDDEFGIRYQGSWSEVWPIEMCGQTVEVLVKFTADGDGGAHYDIPGKDVTIL